MPAHRHLLRFLRRTGALLAASLLLIACTGPQPLPAPADADSALLYGALVAPRLDVRVVYLHQPGRRYLIPLNNPKATVDADGRFVLPNAVPGRYYLAGFSDGTTNYSLSPRSSHTGAVRVEAGEAAHVGSWQAQPAGGNWSSGEFELVPTATPTQAELVEHLRARADFTAWMPALERSLKKSR
jgi:hypothetical protein